MGSETAAARAPRLTFRPDIEGLRAVAVALVVLVHAGVSELSGGYVGVDVFFVISGFLITSLLINELTGTHHISYLGFYARRARRILPVASLVIVVTVVAVSATLGLLVGKSTAVDGVWASLFAANFRFISEGTDYFARALPPSALQHYWSLAVEEQFYLVWPTALFGFALLGRRLGRGTIGMRIGIAAVVVGSLAWSIHQTASAPTTAYFSPFTRAWELGVGALVASCVAALGRVHPVVRAGATWAGLVMVLAAALVFTSTTPFPGSAATLPVAGAALIIAGGIGAPRASAALVLSPAPMRWLGRISFSLYLWHWPILVIAEQRQATPLDTGARIACVALALALSVVTYYAIERPLHVGTLLRPRHAGTDWHELGERSSPAGWPSRWRSGSRSRSTDDRTDESPPRHTRRSIGTVCSAVCPLPETPRAGGRTWKPTSGLSSAGTSRCTPCRHAWSLRR